MPTEAPNVTAGPALVLFPVTPARWDDLAALFESDPACRYCWCMWWREKRSEFFRLGAEYHRQAMRAIVESDGVPGLLMYDSDKPVGWVSVAPREAFPSILRSPHLRPVDDLHVWSIVCLTIVRERRRTGLSTALVAGAVAYARSRGAQAIESYPVREIRGSADGQAFTGALSTFVRAGFRIVADRGGRRVVVRKSLSEETQ